MKNQRKIFAVILIIVFVLSVISFFLYFQGVDHGEDDDSIPPEITSITGDVTGLAG